MKIKNTYRGLLALGLSLASLSANAGYECTAFPSSSGDQEPQAVATLSLFNGYGVEVTLTNAQGAITRFQAVEAGSEDSPLFSRQDFELYGTTRLPEKATLSIITRSLGCGRGSCEGGPRKSTHAKLNFKDVETQFYCSKNDR